MGSPQLKPGAVKTSDIAGGAVNSSKIDDGSIRTRDLAIAPPDGAGGTQSVVYVRTSRRGNLEVRCKPGDQAVSGGGFRSNGSLGPGYSIDVPLAASGIARETNSPTGWLFDPTWGASSGNQTWVLCVRWGEPAAGPAGPTGPTGPAGSIADQQCPSNEFVSGFQNGQVICNQPFTP